MSDHPKPTGEWTADLFMGEKLVPYEQRHFHTEKIATDLGYKIIGRYVKLEAHNAALAAEHVRIQALEEQRRKDIHKGLCDALARADKQLAAEREKVQTLLDALHQIGLLAGSGDKGDPPQVKLEAIARRCEKELAKVKEGK